MGSNTETEKMASDTEQQTKNRPTHTETQHARDDTEIPGEGQLNGWYRDHWSHMGDKMSVITNSLHTQNQLRMDYESFE